MQHLPWLPVQLCTEALSRYAAHNSAHLTICVLVSELLVQGGCSLFAQLLLDSSQGTKWQQIKQRPYGAQQGSYRNRDQWFVAPILSFFRTIYFQWPQAHANHFLAALPYEWHLQVLEHQDSKQQALCINISRLHQNERKIMSRTWRIFHYVTYRFHCIKFRLYVLLVYMYLFLFNQIEIV